MKSLARQVVLTALVLAGFAVLGVGLVAATHEATKARIAENHRRMLLRFMNQVIHPERYDNDILQDTIQVTDPRLAPRGEPVTVYRARIQGHPVAAVFTTVAPDGYNGRIELLVGVDVNGRITGVRVIDHHETPGLGDAIDIRKSDWVEQFRGRRLGDPPLKRWAVKKDGGVFDQFTGATITPRAVVKAVRRTLQYFEEHRDMLFDAPSQSTIGTRMPPEKSHEHH